MKKLAFLLSIILILIPLESIAINIPGYEGGIQNEITYKEIVFVTGEPIEMEGTLSIKTKERNNTKTETYTYRLENKKYNAKLSRTIKLTDTLDTMGNQVTSSKKLDGFKETIDINKKKYEVKDEHYQWNQGSVIHNTPLLSYYAGDFSARKTYLVDRGKEIVTVNTKGSLVGYNGPWSATETQIIDYIIHHEDKTTPGNNWEGAATVETSYNKTKDYSYAENIPNHISFNGGYRVTEKEENVLKYNYDLPRFIQNQKVNGRNTGTNSLYLDTNPKITRLNIPAVRDVLGHKNEEELLLLASMEAFSINSKYLGPSSSMSRGDFARVLIKSMDIPIVKPEVKTSRRKKVEEPKPLFKDVNKDHRNFDYIEEVAKRDMMNGSRENIFNPDKPLTRIEAYSTVIRILGFKNLAPVRKYSLGYKDEKSIPAWARDYIYVAKELGLVERGGYFYPNRELTKGEASKLIVDLISYMQEEIRYDYREGILNN